METLFKLVVVALEVYTDTCEALAKSVMERKARITENLAALRKEFDEAVVSSKLLEAVAELETRLNKYNDAFEDLEKSCRKALGFQEATPDEILADHVEKVEEATRALAELKAQEASLLREVEKHRMLPVVRKDRLAKTVAGLTEELAYAQQELAKMEQEMAQA